MMTIAETIKGGARERVTLPSCGAEVLVGAAPIMDILALGLLPSTFAHLQATEAAKERGEPPPARDFAVEREYNIAVLRCGLIDPPLWTGERRATPEGLVHYADFSDADRDLILGAIMRLSGRSAEEVAAERRFPDGAGSGGDAGPAGDAVPDAAASPAEPVAG